MEKIGGTHFFGVPPRAPAHSDDESFETRPVQTPRATLPGMPLIIILIILLLIFGGGGYYLGPGIGYYGGGLSLVLLFVILFLLFGRGRERL